MTMEMALMVKVKEIFPTMPDDLALKLVPDLNVLTDPYVGIQLPWNRRKRKRLMTAKNVINHMFSGPDTQFWDRCLANEHTEVLCVDLGATASANVLDDVTFAYLLSLCASGRVRAVIGGPPCRTVSALRFQQDGGPPMLRTEEFPYGLPSLTPQQAELVFSDSVLWFRFLLMYVMCEEVRHGGDPTTALVAEQPQDPKLYRTAEEIKEKGFMSMWRTQEWCDLAKNYQADLVHFDQGPMGHELRKPTTLAVIALSELHQLQDVRGKGVGPPVEGQQPPRPRSEMEMGERIAQSKLWACWAPGLKAAIAEALRRWMFAKAPPKDPMVLQPTPTIRSVGAVALQQWKQHYLQDHMPARRDCSHCLRAQGRSRPHKRLEHPEAFTLSLDLSGKLDKGKDQSPGTFRYIISWLECTPTLSQKGANH